ncbi:hypothetical protein ACEQ6C_40325, partial [Rhizobium ruizarguesonis]
IDQSPAVHSWSPFANRCGKLARRSVQRTSPKLPTLQRIGFDQWLLGWRSINKWASITETW